MISKGEYVYCSLEPNGFYTLQHSDSHWALLDPDIDSTLTLYFD